MERRVHLALALLIAACGGGDGAGADPGAAETPPDPPVRTCEPLRRAAEPDLSDATMLATAIYHFNIQYVAGGLEGFGDPGSEFDLSEAEVEDRIVRQGLEPVLDFHLDHPAWGADIELQALMVEIIAERHPDVLDKMRTLAARRQVDFDSFHWSDQLYTAYGRRDMEVSLDLTAAAFDLHCLPVGRSIFTQEGQFAAGQIPLADERGYPVSVLPKNLFKWQFGDEAHREGVLFRRADTPGHTVLVGGVGWDAPDGSIRLTSTFMDDGEIAFTKLELPPYAGTAYEVDAARIQRRVERLTELEAEGWRHVTVAQAVATLLDRGVAPRALPTVLDGTWQPKDTGNLYRWMGEDGLYRADERDGEVLSEIWKARAAVLAAEAAGAPAWKLEPAWRELLLAQVSDSTGWNPWGGEVRYSLDHAAAAVIAAEAAGGVDPGPDGPDCEEDAAASDEVLAALGVEVVSAGRTFTTTAAPCAGEPVATRITVAFDRVGEDVLNEPADAARQRELEVRFARTGDVVRLVQALEDEVVTARLDDYAFETSGQPLAVGLIGLGGDRWAVQDHRSGRTAALIATRGDHRDRIRFSDRTVPRSVPGARRFYLLEGAPAEQALAFARRINGP